MQITIWFGSKIFVEIDGLWCFIHLKSQFCPMKLQLEKSLFYYYPSLEFSVLAYDMHNLCSIKCLPEASHKWIASIFMCIGKPCHYKYSKLHFCFSMLHPSLRKSFEIAKLEIFRLFADCWKWIWDWRDFLEGRTMMQGGMKTEERDEILKILKIDGLLQCSNSSIRFMRTR